MNLSQALLLPPSGSQLESWPCTISKFADDTTFVGLITDNDETAYREEVRDPAVWCQDNNLSLNVSKTKELIVDNRKRWAEQAPIHIVVELVESVKLLSVHITKDLCIMFLAHQHRCEDGTAKPLPPQEAEHICHWSSDPQKDLYNCTIESILTGCITP